MGYLKERLWGGSIYKDCVQWKELANNYKEIPWFYDIYKCTLKKYFLGGTRISESEFYKRNGEYIKFKDGIQCIIPEDKDMRLFKDEILDIVLPLYCSKRYNFGKMDKYIDEGPYELNENVSVNKGDIVFDLGANMGVFSATVAYKAEKVYAFEPSGIIIEKYLKKLVEHYKNIEVQAYALADKRGKAVFSYNINNIGASHMGSSINDKCIEEDVLLISLDEFVEAKHISRVDFIKADIEGAERDMLKGATRVLKEYAPKLSICTYHLPDDKEILEKLILEANPNYKIEHRYKKLYAYVP